MLDTPSLSYFSSVETPMVLLTLALTNPCLLCTKAVKWGQSDICCDQSERVGWYHISCIEPFTQIYNGLVNIIMWICRCGSTNTRIFSLSSPILYNSFDNEHNMSNLRAQHTRPRKLSLLCIQRPNTQTAPYHLVPSPIQCHYPSPVPPTP